MEAAMCLLCHQGRRISISMGSLLIRSCNRLKAESTSSSEIVVAFAIM